MNVNVSTLLPCRPDQAIAAVRTSRLLRFVAHPWVEFRPIAPAALPETWSAGTYRVALRLFGLLPFGRQDIVISEPPAPVFTLRDNGRSAMVRRWDHLITIEPAASGTRYRDHVSIEAGVLTPLVWLFAQTFYRHRQRRWRQLANSGFRYVDR